MADDPYASPTRPAPPRRLNTIELARGLAAAAVVLFHANASADEFGGPQPGWPGFGEHGVDFFFVLSGFIIFAAHRADIGRAGAGVPYMLKRVIRLLPLLAIVVLGWAALRTIAGVPPDTLMVLRSLLLWPSIEPTLPPVVWTLRHEALFYAAFLILIMRPRAGRWLFAAWAAAAAAAVLAGVPLGGVASFLLSAFTLDFMFGIAVAGLWHAGRCRGGWGPLLLSLALLAIALVAEEVLGIRRAGLSDYISVPATFWTLLLGLIFAGVVYGLLAIEDRVRVPRWAILLGRRAYAVYLVHTPVNSLAQHIAAHLPQTMRDWGAGHLLLIVLGILAGIAAHRFVELPVSGALRRRFLPRRAPDGAPVEATGPGGLASEAARRNDPR